MRAALSALLFLAAAAGLARAGDPVTVPDGKFADIKVAAPKGASVVWQVAPRPVQRAADLPPGRLIFAGKPGTTYLVTAVTIDFEKKTVVEDETEVTFGGKAGPPVPDPPKQPDPPAPDGTFYFLVVRADGPASPAFTRTMGLPEWRQLQAAGHSVKDVSATQAAALGAVVPADQLPAVLTLRVDGSVSRVVRPAVPLPTTGAGVLDLPKGVR